MGRRLMTADDVGRNIVIGSVLRDLRRDARMSQADVAAQSAGRFKATVLGAYERGERTVMVEKLVDLAEFYKVDPAHLMQVIERRCAGPVEEIVERRADTGRREDRRLLPEGLRSPAGTDPNR